MIEASSPWVLARASVRGKSHIDGEIVNQDAMHVASRPGEPCFAVAISDGAGSAERAEEGSQHFSRLIADGLQQMAMQVHLGKLHGGSQNLVADQIYRLIADARASLNTGGDSLRKFHCNLMALVLGPKWGLMVYLGDAVMLKSRFERRGDKADFFVETGMTAQDRSEYANETHFLTEPDWTKHLVWNFIDPNGKDDFYALMTDGAADIALGNVPGTGERRVNRGFFAPLLSMVLAARDEPERNQIVRSALEDRQTYRITGDDKTMLLVIRRSQLPMSQYEPELQDQTTLVAAPVKEINMPDSVKAIAAATSTHQESAPLQSGPVTHANPVMHAKNATPAMTSAAPVAHASLPDQGGAAGLPPARQATSGIQSRDKLKYASMGAALMLSIVFLIGLISIAAWHLKHRASTVSSADKASVPAKVASEPTVNQAPAVVTAPATKASEPTPAPVPVKEDAVKATSLATATATEVQSTSSVASPAKIPEPKITASKPVAKAAAKAASAEAATQ